MGKLGKKARKFAKKHLQSVLKKRRKFKSMRDAIKRKNNSRYEGDSDEEQLKATENLAAGVKLGDVLPNEAKSDASLDAIFSDDDSIEEDSGSDGFLSEDSMCPYVADSENESHTKDEGDNGASLGQNEEILMELTNKRRIFKKLKMKDPKFSKFLESHALDLARLSSKEYWDDEGEMIDNSEEDVGNSFNSQDGRVLTLATLDAWCRLVVENQNTFLLPEMLNSYRAACYYGADDDSNEVPCWKIEKKEVFCKILMFMLQEANGIFRKLLGISSTCCKKESVLELKNTDKWKAVRPLVKSYVRSTLYLLDQVSDQQILEYALSRVRALIIFFAAFPTLVQRLIKVAVHLWATGGGAVSLFSFFVIRDIAIQLNSKYLDICLKKTLRAFIAHCIVAESDNGLHIQFLRECVVDLYSLDMHKGIQKANISVQQLARILQQAIKTKKKECLKKISNLQFINCVNLWVNFISANIKDHDLQKLLYLVIQLLCGVAQLFSGPRYLPLRFKCIKMLNQLSLSSGIFIPVASLALDSLDHGENCKANATPVKTLDISSMLKIPKWFLKSRDFQEQCVLSAIKLLSEHFSQWSYHISFPELATIPLIRLRKFNETTNAESLRRLVKRLIDHVEQNIELVQRKRDEVSYSPKDFASIDSFLMREKSSGNAPFMPYYASLQQKLNSQKAALTEKIRVSEQRKSEKRKHQVRDGGKDLKANGKSCLHDEMGNSEGNGSKRQR